MEERINQDILREIAVLLGIEPSFVEKDYYTVKILKELSGIEYENTTLAFSGGTCLSKAYKLIKRFSEDIDFRIITDLHFTKSQRKQFRQFMIDKFKAIEDVELLENTLQKGNESKFFSFYIKYPKSFDAKDSLRENLKIEFSFENALLPVKKFNIQSFIDEFTKNNEQVELNCISPIEIGANKLSALIWRIDVRNKTGLQSNSENDATIIRHLHDLAALEHLILNNDFINSVKYSIEMDKGRGGSNKHISIPEFAQQTLNSLKAYKIYSREYKDFVDALSFAAEAETINFKSALTSFERIVNFIKKSF